LKQVEKVHALASIRLVEARAGDAVELDLLQFAFELRA
jgi:hypothetical protein